MRNYNSSFFALCLMIVLFSCKGKTDQADTAGLIDSSHIVTTHILTAEQQKKLTPAMYIDTLKKGNQEYTEDRLVIRNSSSRIRNAALGQYPGAVVLSCMDSRVPVEDVFHRGIGDIFVIRVAGNIINEDILGSMEYGCKVSGAKVIVVLGHEYCGAIKSAINEVKLGNITPLLKKIMPAINGLPNFKGERKSSNPKFVAAVCDENVYLAIQNIRQQSPILKQMEADHEIMIVGAAYDMKTGKVEFLK
jgi:carbonic anhydrase